MFATVHNKCYGVKHHYIVKWFTAKQKCTYCTKLSIKFDSFFCDDIWRATWAWLWLIMTASTRRTNKLHHSERAGVSGSQTLLFHFCLLLLIVFDQGATLFYFAEYAQYNKRRLPSDHVEKRQSNWYILMLERDQFCSLNNFQTKSSKSP